jgi:hypothetical protein
MYHLWHILIISVAIRREIECELSCNCRVIQVPAGILCVRDRSGNPKRVGPFRRCHSLEHINKLRAKRVEDSCVEWPELERIARPE